MSMPTATAVKGAPGSEVITIKGKEVKLPKFLMEPVRPEIVEVEPAPPKRVAERGPSREERRSFARNQGLHD